MKQTFFQFRQFTIHQDKTAMKVCTDACLFGAWVCAQTPADGRLTGLDIGTGTGLLSLMLAQERDMRMTAIEIDENACRQAAQNVAASPFAEKITVQQANAVGYQPAGKFDLIICNPPFFKDALQAATVNRNLARHETALPLSLLLEKGWEWLAPAGNFYLLMPFLRAAELETRAKERGYFIAEKLLVKQSESHGFFRVMYALTTAPAATSEEEITIRQANGSYSSAFLQYLAPYYLPLHYLRNMK
ncbi:MAG: methyltransferase [Flavihumibacter sp.]